MQTTLEKLQIKLQRLGYVILYLRQPIPSKDELGVIAYCKPEDLDPCRQGARVFQVETVADR
ncbi:MAG: hypothetical protein QNJ62_06575 [Methyloceanibacter sp.]|nr:hypothetical protein [Methyloceanibacter sp.]